MSAIPASIPAPQAVVELINSHCPPGFSVSSVGASVSLFRGASKSPFAAFSYTGPDSVIGIMVAIWRIALAGQADRSVTPKYADPNTVNIEEMKARGDALEILGWPGGSSDPTAWARSYLNIEQMTLADERERAAKAESRIHVLESEATALRDSEQRAVDASIEARKRHTELEQAIDTREARISSLLAALWKLGYHPDMNLDEWAEARVKQRDETEVKLAVAHKALSILGWIPLLSCEPVPWAESKRAEIDGPASMNRRAEIEEAVDWCFTNPGRGLAAELANDAAKALQEKLAASAPEATTLRWAMAQAMHIGAQTAIRWAETEDRRLRRAPGADEALAAETATAALRKEALVVLGWDGMGDPKAWAAGQAARPTESETLAQIRGALLEALGLAEQGTTRPIIELIEQIVAREQEVQQNARRWRDSYEKLADALFGPGALSIPIERACVYAVEARRCVEESVAAIKSRPVDKEAPREPSPRTRWMAFQDAAVALGLSTHLGPDGGVVVTSPSRFAKPATIGVRFALDPGEGADVARVLSTPIEPRRVIGVDHASGESVTCMRVSLPGGTTVRCLIHDGTDWVEAPARAEPAKTVQTSLFVTDGDSRFKIADARRWKRGVSTAQDRTGRVWVTAISGSCAGMTGLPFKPATPAVRFVDANDKLVLAGKVVRYEAKNLGDRLEWEAEVLHEVDAPGLMRDVAAAANAPRVADEQQTAGFTIGSRETVGPRWTGITWMSAKGRAKTCRIEGLTFSVSKLASGDPVPTVIKVPTSPWNLPAKLVHRIHGKKTLSFHVGGGKVITGTVAKVDASAISSMLLYVAT